VRAGRRLDLRARVLWLRHGAAGRADAGEPGQVEDRLEQIAAGADRPIYYLGQRFRDWPLVAAMDDVAGRVDAIYGTCDPDPDSCAPPIDIINEALDPVKWSQAVGCSRLPPVRGVPAVHFGDALVLLTADLLVTLGVAGDDPQTAIAAAEQLRAVGTGGPVQALPPPDPDALRALTIACGQQPGDAGPTLSEPGVTRPRTFTCRTSRSSGWAAGRSAGPPTAGNRW
jgi:hypothetical protein